MKTSRLLSFACVHASLPISLLPAYVPTYLPTYLPTYQPSYLATTSCDIASSELGVGLNFSVGRTELEIVRITRPN